MTTVSESTSFQYGSNTVLTIISVTLEKVLAT